VVVVERRWKIATSASLQLIHALDGRTAAKEATASLSLDLTPGVTAG
jgi:hypothetical protein